MKISIFTVTMTVLVANLISTSAVYAIDDDRKIYPGSMCIRFAGATSHNVKLNASEIGNPSSTQRLRVDCPICMMK